MPNVSDEAGTSNVNLQPTQPTVSDSFLASNANHYEELFRTISFLLEQELVFTKLQPLMKLQKNNDLGLMSLDKINDVVCAEFAEIIAEVIQDKIVEFINQSRFHTTSGDASEPRKTTEDKELVFLKFLADGFKGIVPVTVLLKCQRLKDFGSGNAEGTLSAMIDALSVFSPKETFLKKLICGVADAASVNFGRHQGAITKLSEMVGWDLPTLHCFNHKLELAMSDSYTSDKTFTEIKGMLYVLHRLFKNSGRSWRIYQRVAEVPQPCIYQPCSATFYSCWRNEISTSHFKCFVKFPPTFFVYHAICRKCKITRVWKRIISNERDVSQNYWL